MGSPYSATKLAVKYIRYYLSAANGRGHGAHSPFVFHFITRLLNDRKHYPEYDAVESLRGRMKADNRTVQVLDLGAGSATSSSSLRKVSSIARHAVKPAKYGRLLFRMVRAWQPSTILELGTSLGVTTSYLSLAHPGAMVTSIEGAPEIAAIARQNLLQTGCSHVIVREGSFDTLLPDILSTGANPEFVYVDGNHLQEPTVRYFNKLLPVMQNDSVIIFDDIHWSPEMEAAWKEISSHPSVRCSIDLFFLGIVFFRKEFLEKQHFTIRF
jgi:predicted O-methyltransferase YrrM